jgi:DNA-binding LytR/AlgR family response regulator
VARSDIRYVEAHGDYARLHTATDSHLVRVPLSTLAERWADAGFLRIHRSLLVNGRHVQEVRSEAGRASVVVDGPDGPVELQVARRHTRELRAQLVRRSV